MNVPFTPLAAIGALVFTLINFLKFVSGRKWNSVFTQLTVWVAGVVVVLLFAQTQYAVGVSIGGVSYAKLNVWSLIFVGLIASSLFSTFNEGKKALDASDTSTTPMLFPSLEQPPVRAVAPPPAQVIQPPGSPLQPPPPPAPPPPA